MRLNRTHALVIVACLVAAVSYSGAVSQFALVAYVLPSTSLLALLGVALPVRFGPVFALGPIATLTVAEIVNIVSGNSNGPAARSSFVAAGCTFLAVVAARSRWPTTFLLPVSGVLAGALALGAGGEVRVVAVATATIVVLAWAAVERDHRRWVARPRPDFTVGLACALVVAGALGMSVEQGLHDTRKPVVVGRTWVNSAIHPSWSDPLPGKLKTATHHKNVPKPRRRVHHKHVVTTSLAWLIYAAASVIGFMVAVAAAVGLRMLVVALAWRRLRARLRTGGPRQQVIGAWTWARLRLASAALPLPPSMSPDVASAPGALDDLPPSVADPLQALAKVATDVAFAAAGQEAGVDPVRAWELADETSGYAVGSVRGVRRLRLRLSRPVAARRGRPAAARGIFGARGVFSS